MQSGQVKAKFEYPWQETPAKLIAHGLEHLHMRTDFDQQVGFLLLDLGVETLFKTFLLAPQPVTRVGTKYAERKQAVEGTFHDLLEGVRAAAPSLGHDGSLHTVEYYHGIRNKLYHEGDGVTALSTNVLGYAELAVGLLQRLLDVDLTELLRRQEVEALRKKEEEKLTKQLERQILLVKETLRRFRDGVEIVVTELEPNLVHPTRAAWVLRDGVRDYASYDYSDFDVHEATEQIQLNLLDPLCGEIQNKEVREYLGSREHAPFEEQVALLMSFSDLTSFYAMILEAALSKDVGFRREVYEAAKLYPDGSQQDKFVGFDEDGEVLYTIPAMVEVIEEGKQIVSELEELRERLAEWIGPYGCQLP